MKIRLALFALALPVMLWGQTAHLETRGFKDPKQKVLFEEDENGKIVYTDVVNLEGTDAELKQLVKDYIAEETGVREYEVKYIVDTSRKLVAEITMPIGSQYFAIEVWGSPVVAWNRDASRIKFTCTVEFLNNKYRYRLDSFWTQNRRLPGDALDNGETNDIYRQRVSALQREYDEYAASHDRSKRKVREELYDLQAGIDYEKMNYQASYQAVMDFIEGLRNLKRVDADGDFDTEVASPVRKTEEASPADEIKNYHGNLLSYGNCVYVSAPNMEPYEQSGAMELVKQITIDGIWKVVNDPAKAHFMIEYYVSTEGKDHAWIEIWSNDRQTVYKGFPGSRKGASESISENREVARCIYINGLMPILKKMANGTWKKDKDLSRFVR